MIADAAIGWPGAKLGRACERLNPNLMQRLSKRRWRRLRGGATWKGAIEIDLKRLIAWGAALDALQRSGICPLAERHLIRLSYERLFRQSVVQFALNVR